MKHDVVMWARDGAFCLPITLKRIAECLPREDIARLIFIDDASKDSSASIAKEHGWEVFSGGGKGIGHAANLALSKVSTGRFISFEQDVFLASGWYGDISPIMDRPGVAVAQGWRLASERTLRGLDIVGVQRFGEKQYSIDNNIFDTKAVRAAGGFSSSVIYHVDAVLRHGIQKAGLKWVCDTTVISEHIKPKPYGEYVKRLRGMAEEHPALMRMGMFSDDDRRKLRRTSLIMAFARSPLVGAAMAAKMRDPLLVPCYVALRYGRMMANLTGPKKREVS